jgi:hypothetical protein
MGLSNKERQAAYRARGAVARKALEDIVVALGEKTGPVAVTIRDIATKALEGK